jgi:undecaprenyl-diphosphatase
MNKTVKGNIFSRLRAKDIADSFIIFQTEFFVVLIILAITSFLIYFLTYYIISEKENIIDYKVFLMVRQIINPAGLKAAKIVTILGTGNFLIPAYILIVIYLEKRNYRRLAYLTAVTAVSSLVLGWILKWVFHRSRPLKHLVSGAGGYSFPSGHALGGFIFSGLILYLLWKTKHKVYIKSLVSFLILLLGFGIGISRIYLHVHYATDVLGSLLLAIWWLSFMHIGFRFIYRNDISKIRERQKRVFFPDDYYLNN